MITIDIKSVIRNAANNEHLVEISYIDSKGVLSMRRTEPYEIKGDSYYGYCLDKGGIRAFKLSNIKNAIEVPTRYNPRWAVKI